MSERPKNDVKLCITVSEDFVRRIDQYQEDFLPGMTGNRSALIRQMCEVAMAVKYGEAEEKP